MTVHHDSAATEFVLITAYGTKFHRIGHTRRRWNGTYYTSICGLNSGLHGLLVIDLLKAIDFKPCKRCYREQHCQLCGEKAIMLRKTLVSSKVHLACEICWSENANPL